MEYFVVGSCGCCCLCGRKARLGEFRLRKAEDSEDLRLGYFLSSRGPFSVFAK